MKIRLEGIRRDRDTEEEVSYELHINTDDIACIYKDRYGVAITTHGGKFYRVNHTEKELQEVI